MWGNKNLLLKHEILLSKWDQIFLWELTDVSAVKPRETGSRCPFQESQLLLEPFPMLLPLLLSFAE